MEVNSYNDNANYYVRKHNCLFINIPKVASTTLWSVCSELEKGFIPHKSEDVRSIELPSIKSSSLYNVREVVKIAFVRNPYDRLVSCYRQKIVNVNVNFLKRNNLEPGTTFPEFVNYVCKTPDYKADRHFRSQFTFVFDHQAMPVVETVGRFENFQDDMRMIAENYNLPISRIPLWNSQKKVDYRDFYNDKTTKLVKARYELDLELFKYAFHQASSPLKLIKVMPTPKQELEIIKYKSQKLLRLYKIKEKYDDMPKGVYGLFLRKYKEYFTNYFNENLDL